MNELTGLEVYAISFVRKGANNKKIVLKDATPTLEKQAVIKAVKKGVAYGIVLSPDEVDLQGDIVKAEEIERASWQFLTDFREVTKNHQDVANDCKIVESWILKGGELLFPHEKAGAWAVGIKINDAELLKAVEAGEIQSFSIEGKGVRTPVKKSEEPAESIWEKLTTLFKKQEQPPIIQKEVKPVINLNLNDILPVLKGGLESLHLKIETLDKEMAEVKAVLTKSKQSESGKMAEDDGVLIAKAYNEKYGR